MTDDADATRPRRPPRRTVRRVERAPDPLPEAIPERWQEALPTAAEDDWTAEEAALDGGTGAPTDDAPAVPATPRWLPLLEGRSPDATICPFLRAVGPGEAVGFPVEVPDVSNRCAALHEIVPQSLRQQELVCLTRAHVDCPRYLRGAVVADEVTDATVRSRTQLTPAIAASLIILGLSFAASVAFGLANGGLLLPSSPPSSAGASVAVIEPSPSAAPSVVIEPSPEPTPAGTTTPAPTTAPSASPEPTASPSVTPEPTPSVTPRPSSDRYELLKACPNKPDCYIYKIRSGDNLFSIAKYFGVPLSTVKKLNPWTNTERLRVGRELILPPPTR